MANEITIPLLPCRDLDESIAFYEALGFERTLGDAKGDHEEAMRLLTNGPRRFADAPAAELVAAGRDRRG